MCGNRLRVAGPLWLALTALAAPPTPLTPLTPQALGAQLAGSTAQDDEFLVQRRLALPVDGVKPSDLQPTFSDRRLLDRHQAIDIAAPRGTKVFAVDDGKLVKLFWSVRGGVTVYQFDPSSRYAYYYAHLDRYADGLREGMALRRCDLLGYVGSSGNAPANAPHLHFAVFRLGPEKRWWQGAAVDPYPALRGSASHAAAPSCP